MEKYIDAHKLLVEIDRQKIGYNTDEEHAAEHNTCRKILDIIDSLRQEQEEVELEKFTEKMDAWKARYNYPDNIMVKGAMAFTARMFYMYPKVAREWYDSLPKVTQDF